MPTKGVLFVAYGDAAITQFYIAARQLRRRHDWPVAVIAEKGLKRSRQCPVMTVVPYASEHLGARDAKLMMDQLSPFDWTLYMDADTRVRHDISAVWDILAAGWDMAAVPTGSKTRTGCMRHVFMAGNRLEPAELVPEGLEERNATVAEVGWPFCGWQGGVMAFRKTPQVHAFFECWREEWERWRDQDQPALARAYRRHPVRIFPLGYDFNGGSLVGHYHSMARRRELKGSIAR